MGETIEVCGGSDENNNSHYTYNVWDDFVWTLKNNSVTKIKLNRQPGNLTGKNLESVLKEMKTNSLIAVIITIVILHIVILFFTSFPTVAKILFSLEIFVTCIGYHAWTLRDIRLERYEIHILPKPKEPVYASSGGGGYGDSGGGGFYYGCGDGGAGAAAAISCGDGGGAC